MVYTFPDSELILHLNGKTISLLDIGFESNNNQNNRDMQLILETLYQVQCCNGAASSYAYPG